MAQEKIILSKTGYNPTQFSKVINTTFSQTVSPTPPTASNPIATVNDFFSLYNELFYNIPELGETNSHEYLIKTSSEYINFEANQEEITALQAEIAQLRTELLDTQKQLVDLQTTLANPQ